MADPKLPAIQAALAFALDLTSGGGLNTFTFDLATAPVCLGQPNAGDDARFLRRPADG